VAAGHVLRVGGVAEHLKISQLPFWMSCTAAPPPPHTHPPPAPLPILPLSRSDRKWQMFSLLLAVMVIWVWSPAFGGLVLNAARLQHDVDGQIAPLASWSTNQCAPDGSHDQLLEFSGDSYVIYSGTVPVRLCDRWVKLGRAPVVVPVPGEGPPLDAAPRCMISVGARQRVSPCRMCCWDAYPASPQAGSRFPKRSSSTGATT
jgi:hypothetical protein